VDWIFPLEPLEQNMKFEINPERRKRFLTGDSIKDAKELQSWGRPKSAGHPKSRPPPQSSQT
jgi:hypothetical protein